MNDQVLGTSEQIVKTSSRLKVRLSMPLLVMILMKKRLQVRTLTLAPSSHTISHILIKENLI
jgi:hypothetical protein